MRILFDAQQLSEQMTGVGYYSDRVLRHLLMLDSEHKWILLCHVHNAGYIESIAKGNSNVHKVVLRPPVSLVYSVQQSMLSQLIPQQKIDLYFSPSFLSVPPNLCSTISVVHDATFVLFPEFHPPSVAEYLHRLVTNTCQNATRIITMSENSRQDIARFYHYPIERIYPIPLAAEREFSRQFSPEYITSIREKYNLPERYILAVNMGNPKKNVQTLLKAYSKIEDKIRDGIKLVIVGEWSPKALNLAEIANEVGISEDVILTGYIPREDLYGLFSNATLFCFPSLHEGFGLPVLEAMAAGVPVICSNAASLPEVAGDAAILIDPKDEAAWAEAIECLLQSEPRRKELSEKGKKRVDHFSWERTARETLTVIQQFNKRPNFERQIEDPLVPKNRSRYFIDCGAHVGESILKAKECYGKDICIIAFEGIPYLAHQLNDIWKNDDYVFVYNTIVWIEDGFRKLYLSTEYSDGSSIYSTKTTGGISRKFYIEAPCIDLSRWIRETFSISDEIILKLDVEGAEYPILAKMINEGTIRYINKLCGELHDDKINDEEFLKASAFVRSWLKENSINFATWEAHRNHGKIVPRPTDMEAVAMWNRPNI